MKNIEEVCFIIQARKESTRVPNKMLRDFAGSNLITIAIDKILNSKLIPRENFYLSIMDEEFFEIAKIKDVKTFKRSVESTKEPVTLRSVFEWYKELPYKYYVIINACNPLLSLETIEDFARMFLSSDSRGLFGVLEKKTFFFDKNGLMISNFLGPERYKATLETKMVEPLYEAAHSLYAGTMEDIGKGVYMGSFSSNEDPKLYEIEEIESFDIDWPWQFKVAEELYKCKQ
jgi:CMP-N-acetylneuraminic acid synthetase